MVATVSILLPVLNEEAHLAACIDSLRRQDHPEIVEILVAEGGSTDRTREILDALAEGSPPLLVVDNPEQNQAPGLNRLISRARGAIAVRADAHTVYAPDYVTRCVAALEQSSAAMVGGPMIPQGTTPIGAAIAAAMSSPIGVGNSPYRRPDAAGDADTVYLGALSVERLRHEGGYRRFPSGVGEDADLAYRIRRGGGRVVLDPAIASVYRPRSSFRALWRQFWRYGRGKAEMLYAHGRFPSWRPLGPLLLVSGIAATVALGAMTSLWWPAAVLATSWLAALVVGSARSRYPLATLWAMILMHLSYGSGLLWGLITAGPAVAAMRRAVPAGDPPGGEPDREPEQGE